MVDAKQDAVPAKSILKRRVFGNEFQQGSVVAAPRNKHDNDGGGDCGKRYVTFAETISVKNDKDLVVKKPLKLTLVIENWKSGNATETPLEGNEPGTVRRLVDEFNTIGDPFVDSPETDSTPSGEINGNGEDDDRTDDVSPLRETFATTVRKATTTSATGGGGNCGRIGRLRNDGMVNGLVNMFNSKRTTTPKLPSV